MSEQKCRERIAEMLKVKLSAFDMVKTLIYEFGELSYTAIKRILLEEVKKNEKDN